MRPTLSRPWAGLVIGRGTFDGTELVPKFSKNVSSPGLVAARHMMLCFVGNCNHYNVSISLEIIVN